MAGTEEEKQLFDQAQRFGMAVDTLFTTRGQVTEVCILFNFEKYCLGN